MTNTEFDFLVGRWNSRQSLVEVLAGCDEWYEFDAGPRLPGAARRKRDI